MKYFIRQLGQKDCAFACLKMLLAITHKNKDYLYYQQNDIDRSYSLEEIIKLAKGEGVILTAFRFKYKDDLLKESKLPLLIPVKDGNTLHMVLIRKIKREKITVYDPKRGKIYYTISELNRIWDGSCLEIKEVFYKDYKCPKIKIVPPLFSYGVLALQFVSFLILALAMSTIDTEIKFYIPLIFLAAFIVCEIFYKFLVIKEMKYFDKKIMNTVFNGLAVDFKDRYIQMTNFKKLHLGTPMQIANLILVTGFGLLILGFNSYLNILNFILIVSTMLIMTFVQQKCLKSDTYEIDNLERNIFEDRITSKMDFKSRMVLIQNKTYRYVNLENLKNYIVIFIAGILSLVYSSLSDSISLNFILFHLFMYLTLSKNVAKIVEIVMHQEEYKYYKCLYKYYSME